MRVTMGGMKTLAIANHKGGVGKTATTHALGELIARDHHLRVLMVDLDPQASLTLAAGIQDAAGQSLAEILGGTRPSRTPLANIVRDLGDNLWLAPADIALAAAELQLVARMGREVVLRKALATVAEDYDLCLIDCPPSLGMLTLNGLAAAQAVLVPAQPTAVDLRALRSFLDSLEAVRSEINPQLTTLGILPTFYDARLSHHAQALEALAGSGAPLLPIRIGRSIRVAEAAAASSSVVSFATDNPQAENYRALAKVVTKWLRNQ